MAGEGHVSGPSALSLALSPVLMEPAGVLGWADMGSHSPSAI